MADTPAGIPSTIQIDDDVLSNLAAQGDNAGARVNHGSFEPGKVGDFGPARTEPSANPGYFLGNLDSPADQKRRARQTLKQGQPVLMAQAQTGSPPRDDLAAAAQREDVANGILGLRTALQTSPGNTTPEQESVLIDLGRAKVDAEDLPVRKSPEGAKADYLRYGREAANDIIRAYDRNPSAIINNREQAAFLSDAGVRLGLGVHAMQSPQQAAPSQNYQGDFNYEGLDSDKLKGKVFADGDYSLPPALKAASLKAADELLALEGTAGVMRLLPGVDMKGDGKPTRQEVASYLLAESMQTDKPGPFTNNGHTVESTFNNKFDTRRPLGDAGLEVAKQIFGDNFDASMNTNTPAADNKFKQKMQAILPTPKC